MFFRFEEALQWSKRAAGQFPDWEPAYEITGKVLIKLGRYSSAKKALEKAVSNGVGRKRLGGETAEYN